MRQRFIILFVVIMLALSACGGNNSAATSTPIPTDTPLIPPTLTPTATTPLAILVVPADLDPETSNLYQKTVYDLAQASGFRFQVRNTLTAADLEVLPAQYGYGQLQAWFHRASAGVLELPGAVFVDHTTASADIARELHAVAGARGLYFVDAPVSGGQAGAQNGQLTVMCGGEAAAFEAARPVAMAFSRAFTLMGASGAGQLTKMVNQIAIAGLIQGLAEAVAFGQRAGLDMGQVLEVVSKGAAQSWQMDNRGRTMVADRFDFGFAVDWMRKDLAICLDEARPTGAHLPVTALVDQFYSEIQKMGGRRWDTSSLIKRLER